jgi:hypothetical protein
MIRPADFVAALELDIDNPPACRQPCRSYIFGVSHSKRHTYGHEQAGIEPERPEESIRAFASRRFIVFTVSSHHPPVSPLETLIYC